MTLWRSKYNGLFPFWLLFWGLALVAVGMQLIVQMVEKPHNSAVLPLSVDSKVAFQQKEEVTKEFLLPEKTAGFRRLRLHSQSSQLQLSYNHKGVSEISEELVYLQYIGQEGSYSDNEGRCWQKLCYGRAERAFLDYQQLSCCLIALDLYHMSWPYLLFPDFSALASAPVPVHIYAGQAKFSL